MYAITGITGRVGGGAAETIVRAGGKVRAVVRAPGRGEPFVRRGMEVAVADAGDAEALTAAFSGVQGVFVMVPPNFAPAPGFPETRAIVAALRNALAVARPPKTVVLSSIGAQHDHGLGLIGQLHLLEEELGSLDLPIAFVRPGWFMENHLGDLANARESGTIVSQLQPLDRSIAMVSTADVGRVCGETLLSDWTGRRVVELEGPRRYSPNDLAESLGRAVGRTVEAVAQPRGEWTAAFEAQGMPAGRTESRAEMVDGFNSGWIEFEGEPLRGRVTLDEAIRQMAGA